MKKTVLFVFMSMLLVMLCVPALALEFVEYTYYDAATDSFLPLTEGCVIDVVGPELILRPESGEKGVLYRTVVQGPAADGWFTDCHAYVFEDTIRMYSLFGYRNDEIVVTLTDEPGLYEGLSVVTMRGYDSEMINFSINVQENEDMEWGKYGVMKSWYYANRPGFYPIWPGDEEISKTSDDEMRLEFPWNGSELAGYPDYVLNVSYSIGEGKIAMIKIIEKENGNVLFEEEKEKEGYFVSSVPVTREMMDKQLIVRMIFGEESFEHEFKLLQEENQ